MIGVGILPRAEGGPAEEDTRKGQAQRSSWDAYDLSLSYPFVYKYL